jgi:hypothetical protein
VSESMAEFIRRETDVLRAGLFEPITFTHERMGTDPEGRAILKPTLSDEMRARLYAGLPDDEDDEVADHASVSATKQGAYILVSHDVLADYTDHVCTADCPPLWTPEPVPLRRRVRYAIRRAVRAVTGLRVVHKDRIRGDDEYSD